jgi:hypothetical protein
VTTERFVFDFDELEANGLPYCRIDEPYWPHPPTASGLLESIVGPFLRSRDRVRRILMESALRNLELAGDRMTAQLLYDGGQESHLVGAVVTGQSKPPEPRYCYGEPYEIAGEATVDLGLGGPPLKATGIKVFPIREITTTEEKS